LLRLISHYVLPYLLLPCVALFPYTTLFRSTLVTWILLSLAVPAIGALVIAPLLGVTGLTTLLTVTLAVVLAIGFPLAGLIALVEDRKSTRLNSSHVSISYAVFCLNKKRPGQ